MRNSLVSIIIPVYNGSDFVAEAIQSALDQDYPNIEVIVVNDGSTDKGATDRVCQSFGQKIRYFKKLNGGVATALNLGIKKMKGEYFSWLSHDDVYFSNKVSQQIRFLEKYPKSTIAYSNFVIINEKGRLLDKIRIPDFDSSAFAKELMLKSFLHGCTLLIPREIFSSVGDFNPKLITTQDYELWFRMIKKGFKFEKCPEFLVKARSHANQGTHTKHNLHLEEKDNLYRWILEKLPPKLLFGTSANFRLEYANLKAIFDNAGFVKSGSLTRKLSLQNSSLADLFLIFALAPIKNFAVKAKKTIFKFYRYAKRRINAFSVTKNEQEGIVNISKICLIGNINSVHNLKLCRYLLSKNFFVYFISNKPGKIKGVISLDLSKKTDELKIIWFMRAILETRRWLRKIKPDVVHCQSLIPAGVWAGLSGFHPYIIWLFGSEIFNFKSYHFLLKLLATYALKNADSITGSSRVLLDESVAKGARAELTKLILNGVDLSVFKPSAKKSETPLIFCPRAIKPIYQTMALVKAFERSLEDSPDLKLALIKFNVDELYLKEIKKYLSQRNLTKKVIFLKPAENQQMAKYYQKAEVVVSIPQWDSSSVSFLEGLACNKKMVVSNLPFLQDWSGLKLWKCKVGDIDSTAKAIRLALQSEVVDNRTKIAKEISLEKNYETLINLYSDCFKIQR